jgi:hypothetical protein
VGHQDSDLELRAMFADRELEARPVTKLEPEAVANDRVDDDHDFAQAWRQTARFFRKAA